MIRKNFSKLNCLQYNLLLKNHLNTQYIYIDVVSWLDELYYCDMPWKISITHPHQTVITRSWWRINTWFTSFHAPVFFSCTFGKSYCGWCFCKIINKATKSWVRITITVLKISTRPYKIYTVKLTSAPTCTTSTLKTLL